MDLRELRVDGDLEAVSQQITAALGFLCKGQACRRVREEVTEGGRMGRGREEGEGGGGCYTAMLLLLLRSWGAMAMRGREAAGETKYAATKDRAWMRNE